MRFIIFDIVLVLILPLAGCANASAVHRSSATSSPPRKCEITLGSWCIFESNIVIQHRQSRVPAYDDVWRLWGSDWKKYPSVILEPSGCRKGLSDAVELIGFDARFEFDDRIWNAITVSLKSDGTCNLKLLSPTLSEDPTGVAFATNLGLIRVCRAVPCLGPVLGEYIWPEVQRK